MWVLWLQIRPITVNLKQNPPPAANKYNVCAVFLALLISPIYPWGNGNWVLRPGLPYWSYCIFCSWHSLPSTGSPYPSPLALSIIRIPLTGNLRPPAACNSTIIVENVLVRLSLLDHPPGLFPKWSQFDYCKTWVVVEVGKKNLQRSKRWWWWCGYSVAIFKLATVEDT